MNRITHKEFLKRLKNSDSTIMKELYTQWKSWLYNEFKAYEYNENLILINGKDKYRVNMFIFNYDNCIELLKKYKDDYNCTDLCVSLIGEIPEELNKYYGFRCFERLGVTGEIKDNNIRLLTKDSVGETIEFCNKLSQDNFSKDEAETLQYYIENIEEFKKYKTYGYYKDEMLIGFVMLLHDSSLHYSHLSDIGVLQEFRRLGIGAKLGRFVMSLYPNEKYHYQLSHLNKASIGLATSLGFNLVGVRELIIKWSK